MYDLRTDSAALAAAGPRGRIEDAIALLPTPAASLGSNGGPQHPDKRRAGGHSVSIEDAVHGLTLLPTPAAMNPNDGEGTASWLARRERVKITANNGNGMGMPLAIAVQLLPTPTTTQRGTDVNLDSREGARANLHNEVADATNWGKYAAAIARHELAFGHPAPSPTEPAAKRLNRHGNPRSNPRLSARFVEWMMMLPAGWITDVPGVTRNEALKMLGNGVVGPQCVAALRIMLGRTI